MATATPVVNVYFKPRRYRRGGTWQLLVKQGCGVADLELRAADEPAARLEAAARWPELAGALQ